MQPVRTWPPMKSYKSLSAYQKAICWTAALVFLLLLVFLSTLGTPHHVLGGASLFTLVGLLLLLAFLASLHNSNRPTA